MLIDDEDRARKLARSLLADIALYHREDLRAGRDMSATFDEARLLYRGRVAEARHAIFDVELAAFVVRDEARPAPPAERREQTRSTLAVSATAFVVVALIAGMWWATRTDGEAIARVAIPGRVTVHVERGDRLHFEADHDVAFRAAELEDEPDGCMLALEVRQGDHVLSTLGCDLFRTTATTSIADANNAEVEPDGLTHLTIVGMRLGCTYASETEGELLLVASSNLSTCVPRAGGSTLHVFRAHRR